MTIALNGTCSRVAVQPAVVYVFRALIVFVEVERTQAMCYLHLLQKATQTFTKTVL